MQFKYSVLTASLATALALSGCGGGGDSSTAPAGSSTGGGVIITAMDGYLINALVCSDTNNNGSCDRGEQIGLTNEEGKLDKTVTKEKEAEIKAHPIVVKVLQPFVDYSKFGVKPGTYTLDKDQPYQPMDKDVVFRAPAGAEIVSPITDLIVAEMSNGKKLEEAETSVQEMLSGLTEGSDAEIDLYADYIKAKDEKTGNSEAEKELAAKLHKTAQILTETKDSAEASDEKLDEVISEVVDEAVDSVKSSSPEEIKDPNFKPSVPVSDTGEVKTAVTNYQAVVSEEIKTALQKELNTAFKTKVDITFTSAVDLTDLISDKDNGNPVVSITGMRKDDGQKKADLKAEGLDVQLNGQHLEIRSLNNDDNQSLAKSGTYEIELSADDLDSQSNKVGTVKALISFKVEPYNSTPTVVQEAKEAIQEKIGSLSLQAKEEMPSISIVLDRLFTDADGDNLTLSVTGLPAGISYDQALLKAGTLQLTGTPAVSGKYTFTVTATDTDGESVEATFTLPEIAVAPITDNPLSDLLVGKTLYRFNAESVSDTQYIPKADCWAIRLTEDHKVLEAEMVNGQCPAEDSEFTPNGTWTLDGNNIAVSLDDDGTATLSLHKDESTAELARVHLFLTEAEVSASGEKQPDTAEPATFYIGEQAATAYWKQQESHVWVQDQLVLADAQSKPGSTKERDDTLDADLFFNVSCEKLGFEKDGRGDNSYRWTDKVPYDFYLLNSKFSNGMFKAPSGAIGFAFGYPDECVIDFDYTQPTTIAAGDSVVVLANPRDGFNAEEFIINTIVEPKDTIEPNDTIEPQASLDIDEQGIFYISIGGSTGHGSLVHTYKDGDKIVTQERYYNTSDSWSDSWEANTEYSFTPYEINGNKLYQVSVQMTEDIVTSYTYWTNDTQYMLSLFAGQELCMDGETSDSCAEPEATRYYTDEESAKQALEAALNQPITFSGHSWYVKDSKDDKENYTITFGDRVTAIFDYSEPGEKSTYEMNWDQLASEIAVPACVADDSCTLQTFNTAVEQCDSNDGSTFENCDLADKYFRTWSYNTEDDSITEQKYSMKYNKVTNKATWTKKS